MKRGHSFSVVLLVAVVAGGCASPQMSRIDRHRDIYESWPIDVRQAVLDGKVEPGMNSDMVRLSWGEPTEISVSPAGDEIWIFARGGDPGSVYYPGSMGGSTVGMGGTGIGVGGPGIGISTGRGGTAVGATGGIGVGGGMGGVGIGGTGLGGPSTAIITPPRPPDIREVIFRNGVVVRADPPFSTK